MISFARLGSVTLGLVMVLSSCGGSDGRSAVNSQAGPGVTDTPSLAEPSDWWTLDDPNLKPDQYIVADQPAEQPSTLGEVYGTSTRLEDLLQSSLLFLKPSSDLPIVPQAGEAKVVDITEESGAGALYQVGAAKVLRWLGASSTTFVMIGRGIDDEALISAAASVKEGTSARDAVLTEPPKGLDLQFSSAYVGDGAPATKVDVGSTARYTTSSGSSASITATGASDELFTAAVLATGADENAFRSLQGDDRAVVAPAIGVDTGKIAVWRTPSDLVAVVVSNATDESIVQVAQSARAHPKETFAALTVGADADEGGTLISGSTSLGRWDFRYDGDGFLTFTFTDQRGAETSSSMGAPADVEYPPILTIGIFPIGDSTDVIVGRTSRDATSVEVEVKDGSRIAAELRDVDAKLPYLIFVAQAPSESFERAVALQQGREIASTE